MSGTTVVQPPGDRIESCDKQRAQRLYRRQTSRVAIDSADNRFRISAGRRVRAKQTNQGRDPHARGESFAADVAKRQDQTVARLFDTKKVSGQMTNGKDLTRHVETAVTHKTRRTQSPVHLRRFEDRSV